MQLATFYDHVQDISKQEKVTMHEALCRTKKMGIDFLNVSSNNIKDREEEVRAELEAADLKVSSVCAYFSFEKTGGITEEDIRELDKALFFGTKNVLVIPGFFEDGDTEEEKEKKLCNMISAIKELQKEAEKRGITLMMEEYDNILAPFSTIAGACRFLDEIPELVVAFDTGNFLYSDEDVLEAYVQLRERVGFVHLKDRSLENPKDGGEERADINGRYIYSAPVGFGVIPIAEIITKLQADGYSGIYTIEQYGSARSQEYMQKAADWLRNRL